MNLLPPVRLFPAFAGALLLSVLVFLFMQGLIDQGLRERVELPLFEQVQILQQQEPQQERQEQALPQQQAAEQPQMAALAAGPMAPAPAPLTAAVPELPALQPSSGDLALPRAGQNWSVPLGRGGQGLPLGQDARGYVEVVPFNTRRPNVPESAWHNRVSGWVLVAFTVTPEGATGNVRVLDASPRGVFEDTVIAAVRDWRYTLSFSGGAAGDVVLTQKVSVNWRDYPQNLPNVD